MLGNRTIDNIKSIGSCNPSFYASHYDNFVYISLYIDKKSEYSDFEVIASVSAERQKEEIDGHPVYQIIETSGAYPGFGSLAYQLLMIELSQKEQGALLLSDRECVSKDAKSLYEKMAKSDEFTSVPIAVDSPYFSLEFDANEELCDGHILNHAYACEGNEVALKYHQILTNNHEKRDLSDEVKSSLIEDGELLGEWVELHHEELIELRNNNFSELRTFSPKEEEYDF